MPLATPQGTDLRAVFGEVHKGGVIVPFRRDAKGNTFKNMGTTSAQRSQSGVDLDLLAHWMDSHDLAGGDIVDAQGLGGGTQNVMVQFTRGGRSYVLRRGPHHLRPQSNKVITREITLLQALSGTDVPHPQLIAGCTDETVLGAVFYLMEPVDGFNAAVSLPAGYAQERSGRHAMGLAIVDALATLGDVDHVAAGLADFGRPDGFLERQVPRWLGEMERYASTPGYPGPPFTNLDAVADFLERHRPATFTPGILHGDYHIANVMYAPTEPHIAAIVDWEMATIGDPLLDLGALLAVWPDGEDQPDLLESALGSAGGLPSRTELVARYGERSGRDLSAISWYSVLACFKLGLILEGTYARACAGKAPRDVGDRLHSYAIKLFDRAGAFIADA